MGQDLGTGQEQDGNWAGKGQERGMNRTGMGWDQRGYCRPSRLTNRNDLVHLKGEEKVGLSTSYINIFNYHLVYYFFAILL